MKEKTFYICVDGVYIKDGKILLLKRAVAPFRGCWHLVGGHVEENETLKEALRREFKEETNLDVEVGEIIDGRIEKTLDRTKIVIAFEVTFAKGEIRLNSESEEYEWFTQIPFNCVYDYAKYLKKKRSPLKSSQNSSNRRLRGNHNL
jgi:ADP-ribose pyrophosphatase YjhB (NUDIX family)